MTRNLFSIAGGMALGFALLIIGAWLTVQLEPGTAGDLRYVPFWAYLPTLNSAQNASKADAMFLFYQFVILYPLLSIAVGLFVGRFAHRRAWWLASLSLLPVLTLQSKEWTHGTHDEMSLVVSTAVVYYGAYIVLSLAAAYIATRRYHGNSEEKLFPR